MSIYRWRLGGLPGVMVVGEKARKSYVSPLLART